MELNPKKEDELLQLVTFSVDVEEFGVNILKVQEIIRIMEITKVPQAPEFVEGIINLRGKVVPVIDVRLKFNQEERAYDEKTCIIVTMIHDMHVGLIDLRHRFGLVPKTHDKNTRIIVIEVKSIIVGFVVDAVSEVLRIPASTVEPPSPIVAGVDSDYISGVGKLQDRLLIMLDLDKLLSIDDISMINGM